MKSYLPFTHALAWIVASTFMISGGSYALFKQYLHKEQHQVRDPNLLIRTIVQTGPQKEALKTDYLAELLGLSSDRPPHAHVFNLKLAEERLLKSPLIARAQVKLIPPSTLYIDYTIRQPIARLEDFENVVIDKEGYVFPFKSFFSPKNLPQIYLGLNAFGLASVDPDRPTAQWGTPLTGKYLHLAFEILTLTSEPKVAELFSIKRIDVSNAFAESYGTREIIVITEDLQIRNIEGREVHFHFPRLLRLSTKHYAQELGNYLKLRPQLLEEERKLTTTAASSVVRFKEKVIDFRIQQLAFIDEKK